MESSSRKDKSYVFSALDGQKDNISMPLINIVTAHRLCVCGGVRVCV